MAHIYEFVCKNTACGYIRQAAWVTGNTKCPRYDRQAFPREG